MKLLLNGSPRPKVKQLTWGLCVWGLDHRCHVSGQCMDTGTSEGESTVHRETGLRKVWKCKAADPGSPSIPPAIPQTNKTKINAWEEGKKKEKTGAGESPHLGHLAPPISPQHLPESRLQCSTQKMLAQPCSSGFPGLPTKSFTNCLFNIWGNCCPDMTVATQLFMWQNQGLNSRLWNLLFPPCCLVFSYNKVLCDSELTQ